MRTAGRGTSRRPLLVSQCPGARGRGPKTDARGRLDSAWTSLHPTKRQGGRTPRGPLRTNIPAGGLQPLALALSSPPAARPPALPRPGKQTTVGQACAGGRPVTGRLPCLSAWHPSNWVLPLTSSVTDSFRLDHFPLRLQRGCRSLPSCSGGHGGRDHFSLCLKPTGG